MNRKVDGVILLRTVVDDPQIDFLMGRNIPFVATGSSQVLRKLREKHVKVPKDVKVASFYNSSVLENNVPSITSLFFDARELGMTACKNLLNQIEEVEVPVRTLLPYEVILKESTT